MSIKDDLVTLKKRYAELEKKVIKAEAESGLHKKDLQIVEKELKKLTGLQDLAKLDDYIENLEKEVSAKKTVLMEKLSEFESKVTDLKVEESVEKTGIEEELEEI